MHIMHARSDVLWIFWIRVQGSGLVAAPRCDTARVATGYATAATDPCARVCMRVFVRIGWIAAR
jgi:hypothetical protein